VDARPVDARDISVEWDADIYRVYFWSTDGRSCEEHELSSAADVREVVAWAEARAADRIPEIFVRHDHPPDRGLIRISGGRPGHHSHEIHVFGETPPLTE
jgi:hypothetical protein